MKKQYIPALIAFAREWAEDAWQQDAGPDGMAVCAGCRHFLPVVYASGLQWCKDCYPSAAPYSQDTQSKDWQERRAGQERDYEWAPLSPSTGKAT